MKISIAWIFDHIDADYTSIDIAKLVDQCNKTTAEIEGWKNVSINLDQLTVAEIVSVEGDQTIVRSDEWNKEITLPVRNDISPGQWYLIIKEGESFSWALMDDLGGSKELLLPAMYVDDQCKKGVWKKNFESKDYVLEVDNKSITHRPDMWGHRGFAREIAAMLDMPFKTIDSFLAKKKINCFTNHAPANETNPYSITIQDPDVIKRFAGLYIKEVVHYPTLLWMASRLARVDSRSIDTLVDLTNYVMLDFGQPMHVFDALALTTKKIIARRAHTKEKLTILDDDKLELTPEDIVIADDKRGISLGGVMGGSDTGITSKTKSVFLESANFDATTIRRTSVRHKKRTDASSRFEKSLDPNQNIDALLRFLKLLDDAQIPYVASETISSVGPRALPGEITISHEFIEKRLGTVIELPFILQTLQKLECGVEVKMHDNGLVYLITVPTFRSTKDIEIPVDIVEEIGRFFGYDRIQQQLPSLQLQPADLSSTYCARHIKRLLSYGFSMRELCNYSFYDESFLRMIEWEPTNFVSVQNPVSENYYRLVTSLIPHLFKAVSANGEHLHRLRFFELGRIWSNTKGINEKKSLAGIMYEQKQQINFYDLKVLLEQLFALLNMPVKWQQVEKSAAPWFVPYQTAHIISGDTIVGTAGMIDELFLQRISPGGAAFAFELSGDFILSYKSVTQRYVLAPKYPQVIRDISMLIALKYTSDELTDAIKSVDSRITAVMLIDFFSKPEWKDQKSLAFRVIIQDPEKTLTKQEVDAMWLRVEAQIKKRGATIR